MVHVLGTCVCAAFTGSIPANLGKLGSEGNGVVEIYLQGNKLNGTLPSNVEQLTSLKKLTCPTTNWRESCQGCIC